MSFRPVINSLSRKIVDFKRGYKKYDSNMGSNMGNTEDDYHTNTTLIGTSGNNNM